MEKNDAHLAILHHVLCMGVLDNWRFCPRCGGNLTQQEDHLACDDCDSWYWGNAIPGVQGILERDGRVLLARRAHEPRRGHWDLPGGFVNETEDPLDALRREFREETGLEVEPVELMRIDVEPTTAGTSSPSRGSCAARANRSLPTTSPSCAGSRATSCRTRWRSPGRTTSYAPGWRGSEDA